MNTLWSGWAWTTSDCEWTASIQKKFIIIYVIDMLILIKIEFKWLMIRMIEWLEFKWRARAITWQKVFLRWSQPLNRPTSGIGSELKDQTIICVAVNIQRWGQRHASRHCYSNCTINDLLGTVCKISVSCRLIFNGIFLLRIP